MKKILLSIVFCLMYFQVAVPMVEEAIMMTDIEMLRSALPDSYGAIASNDASRFVALADEMIIHRRNQLQIYQIDPKMPLNFLVGAVGTIGFVMALCYSYTSGYLNWDELRINSVFSAGLLASLYLTYRGIVDFREEGKALVAKYRTAIMIKHLFLAMQAKSV